MERRREEIKLHWNAVVPIKALCALLLALGLSVYDDYLGQGQEYLMNYRLLVDLVILIGAVVLSTQVLLYPLTQKSLVFPVLFAVSSYLVVYWFLDTFGQWFGFRYGALPMALVDLLALCFYAYLLFSLLKPHLRTKSALRKGMALGILPVLLLTMYSFLGSYNFFSQRAGSYPDYPTELYQTQTQGEQIRTFFQLTE